MARVRADQPLVPSVVDGLLDDAPEQSREAARNRAQLLRELKQSVRRDLENLLNTRRRPLELPPGLKELDVSLVNYGIPDFTGSGPATALDRAAFCKSIQEIIRRYEPPLHSVTVQPSDAAQSVHRPPPFPVHALPPPDPA